jgi:hypothetical protein
MAGISERRNSMDHPLSSWCQTLCNRVRHYALKRNEGARHCRGRASPGQRWHPNSTLRGSEPACQMVVSFLPIAEKSPKRQGSSAAESHPTVIEGRSNDFAGYRSGDCSGGCRRVVSPQMPCASGTRKTSHPAIRLYLQRDFSTSRIRVPTFTLPQMSLPCGNIPLGTRDTAAPTGLARRRQLR